MSVDSAPEKIKMDAVSKVARPSARLVHAHSLIPRHWHCAIIPALQVMPPIYFNENEKANMRIHGWKARAEHLSIFWIDKVVKFQVNGPFISRKWVSW